MQNSTTKPSGNWENDIGRHTVVQLIGQKRLQNFNLTLKQHATSVFFRVNFAASISVHPFRVPLFACIRAGHSTASFNHASAFKQLRASSAMQSRTSPLKGITAIFRFPHLGQHPGFRCCVCCSLRTSVTCCSLWKFQQSMAAQQESQLLAWLPIRAMNADCCCTNCRKNDCGIS